MDGSIFWGGSVIAAVLAGTIALFAPCCISVMLPAYFASSFHNRGVMVAMTFLFASGIATVVLPIAMGATLIRGLITTQHATIYIVGGLLMFGFAAFLLAGGQLHLPAPGRGPTGKAGPLSVYTLGIFSGIASSCCAPVLAGVIALASAASSFGFALGLGLAYVFGMVAPLLAIAFLWERRDWRTSRLFRPRSFTWGIGRIRRTVSTANLASATLLTLMGTAMVWLGLTSDGMRASTGWQLRVSSRLQHWGRQIVDALAWLPGWAAALALTFVVVLLARRAIQQVGWTGEDEDPVATVPIGLGDAHEQEF